MVVLPASVGAAGLDGRIIDAVRIESDGPLPAADVHALIGISPGDRYSAGKVREAVRRLYETGKYKTVWVEAERLGADRIALRFFWVEEKILAAIRVKGNRALSKAEILETIALHEGKRFDDAAWKRALSALAARYRRAGYFRARIRSEIVGASGMRRGGSRRS